MDNTIYIFRPYITVKGKRIYRKNGGMFKIPVGNKKTTLDQKQQFFIGLQSFNRLLGSIKTLIGTRQIFWCQ